MITETIIKEWCKDERLKDSWNILKPKKELFSNKCADDAE